MTTRPPTSPPSISDAPWLRAPATQAVFAALNQHGHSTRAVGGCIRNTLLVNLNANASQPHKTSEAEVTDIDLATTALPDEALKLASKAGLRTVPTGLQHGTVTVIADGHPFEVTTLRRDISTDGRHAEVAFTDDWALDAARRDFTMNALYADAAGTVYDPISGYPDLQAGRVRFIGDAAERIREDFLRILRFFRFFATYGTDQPDQDGLNACLQLRGGLSRLSEERIRQEFLKLLEAPLAGATVEIMSEHGILAEILPIAPNHSRLAAVIARDSPPDGALRLAALAVQTEESARKLIAKLRLSNQEAETLLTIAHSLEKPIISRPKPEAARQLYYRLGKTKYLKLMKFYWALSADGPNHPEWQTHLNLPNTWQPPAFPITGQDLIARGFEPGPALGTLRSSLMDLWLRSDFTLDRDELLQQVETLINQDQSDNL